MPTLPSHQFRQVAEGFGANADRYDRARPDYPDDMVRRIVAATPGGARALSAAGTRRRQPGPGPAVLDVGCGTGIAARQFQAAGCRVLGLDVDPRMAGQARQRGLEVEVSAFEAWEPAGRSFDAVVAGQTWHWIDPVAGAAKAAEALRPGGRLALFWNVFQPPPALAAAFAAVYREVLPALPPVDLSNALSVYQSMVTTAADGIRQAGAFDEPAEWRFDWERHYSRQEWLDQVPTHGGANQLPPGRLAALLAGLGAAIDAVGGGFPMRYATVVVTAARTRPVPAQ